MRRRAIGAELVDGGVHFRVWAPSRERVAVVIGGRDHPLAREVSGHFSGLVAGAAAGTRYRFRLDSGDSFPDPASRFQPDGPHGDSAVIDPSAYAWTTSDWRFDPRNLIIEEIHIGTFTPKGTFAAAAEKLPLLRDAGINTVEVMPVAEFPGRFGWGYDGVDPWAPTHLYGTPDDFRRFVDAAHAARVAVLLDVVYNHLGPDGCYLAQFTPHYFTKKYVNDWGDSLNFDGEHSAGVREYFAENAAYWIDELHLDGLRLDATQSIDDSTSPHVLRTITDRARAAAGDRTIVIVAENEPQDVRLLEEFGVDAMWNDDWHHAARIALGGRAEAYYSDYRGRPQEFVSMARHGFLYQGQRYSWQKNRRGTPSAHIAPERLICFIENHDQVANSATGARMRDLADPGSYRAMTALLLLAAQTPMLFQGQEWGSSRPFLYFADHKEELARAVAAGRREFLGQFPSIDGTKIAPPHDPRTFESCKLDWSSRDESVVALHRDLIALRRPGRPEGALLSEEAFLLRWPDRLLLVNLGPDLRFAPASEPLLAPPARGRWQLLWSSESAMSPESPEGEWFIPGHAAVLLESAT